MPEVYFQVRWPDGVVRRCYSPSTVIEDVFMAGTSYPVADFVDRSRQALGIGGERVRAKYGFACTAAAEQLAEIEAVAAGFNGVPEAVATVEAIVQANASAR